MSKEEQKVPLSSPEGNETDSQPNEASSEAAGGGATLSATLERMKRHASEGDEAPAASLRFRDILGGDYLWALVRHQLWVIMLVVLITTAYIGVRYQCQQDMIDISQLEKDLIDAKFQALSSSSNLTRMCRQSNVLDLLNANSDSLLHISQQPPYIIEVGGEK